MMNTDMLIFELRSCLQEAIEDRCGACERKQSEDCGKPQEFLGKTYVCKVRRWKEVLNKMCFAHTVTNHVGEPLQIEIGGKVYNILELLKPKQSEESK